jgi:hypothetical protein
MQVKERKQRQKASANDTIVEQLEESLDQKQVQSVKKPLSAAH